MKKKRINTYLFIFLVLSNIFVIHIGNALANIKDNLNVLEQQNEILMPEEQNITTIKDTKNTNKANIIVLKALNKITAKSYQYESNINNEIKFERLTIKPLFCWKSSPDDVPENKVLLRVYEKKLDGSEQEIFYGWMFSSSPELSSIQHPMYDITVVDCFNK